MNEQIDVIGDIHGNASTLHRLLREMGYVEQKGSWKHSERFALFVGDCIDAGPEQTQAIKTVRAMVEAGNAIALMGNHEFNAMCWSTEDPNNPGDYLRSHYSPEWGAANRKQHSAFLAEVEDHPQLHREIIDWFFSLPLWFETEHLRVAHACWDACAIQVLERFIDPSRRLPPNLIYESNQKGSSLNLALERVLKGQEVELPRGLCFQDGYGIRRTHFRRKWWDSDATTYRRAALLSDTELQQLPDEPLPDDVRYAVDCSRPTFFGHYCLKQHSGFLSDRFVCVDTCAAKGGRLTAYRWSGEARLNPANLYSVRV